MNVCKVCSQEFPSERSLHAHLKVHGLILAEYYTQYYPRNNLLTGEPLPFKNKQDYFSRDFSNRDQLIAWCKQTEPEVVKNYILNLLKKRIKEKALSCAPNHLELKINELPTIDIYKEHFGSYTSACESANVKPMFGDKLPLAWQDAVNPDITIFIDTREQQPLVFPNQESMKLEFGDYAIGGEHYNYTFVDRKSERDFKSTMSKNNLDRFDRELQRAKDFDSYLFVVIESDLEQIQKNNPKCSHKSNLKYIYHNMREFSHKFSNNCQFVFTGSRERSEYFIPKLLTLGKKVWNVDLQYYIDRGEI